MHLVVRQPVRIQVTFFNEYPCSFRTVYYLWAKLCLGLDENKLQVGFFTKKKIKDLIFLQSSSVEYLILMFVNRQVMKPVRIFF
jgi:hypothetical protein